MNIPHGSRLEQILDEGRERLERLGRCDLEPVFGQTRLGLEKESLRVAPSGHLALTPHPRALGSTLTHPYITTDFSEALMEFVTPPFPDTRDTLRFLNDLHVFTYQHLDDELLWCASMPCMVPRDDEIPIADYGQSNVGTMKTVYRRGLSYRYGRVMQTIAGVHFNYSLPDSFWGALAGEPDTEPTRSLVDDGYFGCVRNFLRFGWLVPLLFGSSPAVCKSFVGDDAGDFQMLDDGTCFHPHATSLRMSDVGYKNTTQAALSIDYDNLDGYVRSLTAAIETPHADYERIGIEVDGEYRQLNANILQIENEFYSSVRPKQITRSGEKPTLALRRRGVRYLEVRSLDLDPFAPTGVSLATLRVLETLVVLCAALPSPSVASEYQDIQRNLSVVPKQGRDPSLEIRVAGCDDGIFAQARRVLDAMTPVAAMLDAARGGISEYRDAVATQRRIIDDPAQLPSARILSELRETELPFFRFAMNLSTAHANALAARTLSERTAQMLREESVRSLEQQQQIENADSMSFAGYLERYFNQTLDQRETLLG